jgi:hypothetical protein
LVEQILFLCERKLKNLDRIFTLLCGYSRSGIEFNCMCCFFNLDSITSCELRISFRKCESSVCRSWFALSLNLDFVTSFALKLSWGGKRESGLTIQILFIGWIQS